MQVKLHCDDKTVSVSMSEGFMSLMSAVPKVQEWVTYHEIDITGWRFDLHCRAYYDSTGDDKGYAKEVGPHLQTIYDMHLVSLWLG